MKTRSGWHGVAVWLTLSLAPLGCSETDDPIAAATDQPQYASAGSEAERNSGKVSDRFPNIELRTQDDEAVRFYDDLVKDKIVVVNFMYTTCTGI